MSTTPNQDAFESLRDELLVTLVPHTMHRLGNLLTVVMGTSELLSFDETNPKRSMELAEISSVARRATGLVQALGLHARSRAGAEQAIDLQELVASICELASPVANGASYEFELRESSGITVVRSDAMRLQLLLLCLVSSAIGLSNGLVRREGRVNLRVVGMASRVVILLSLRVSQGVPPSAILVEPRLEALATELGVNLRTRTHPGGMGQSLLLGLPGI